MKIIENQKFDEERALYGSSELLVRNCSFDGPADGESAFKECCKIEVEDCFFNLRYPFWNDSGLKIRGCEMTELCRASLWYSEHIEITDTKMHGIKALRECRDVVIDNCDIISPEFGWSVNGIQMKHSTAESEYFMMRATDLNFSDVQFKGKYSFQYIKNAVLDNCVLDTKDAFWHSENVTVKNSVVKGEYLAWYSDGLTLINCKIIGTQPLCYCKNLTLINCEMVDTDLCFERSEVQAILTSSVDSIKNPLSGWIQVTEVGEIIMDVAEATGKVMISDVDAQTEEFQKTVSENKKFVKEFIQNEIPQIQVASFYDTCFLRLNFVRMIGNGMEAVSYIKEKTGVYFSYGKQNGQGGNEFLRINTACSRSVLERSLQQLKAGITAYEKFCVERC